MNDPRFYEVQRFAGNSLARFAGVAVVLTALVVAAAIGSAVTGPAQSLDPSVTLGLILLPVFGALVILLMFGRMTTIVRNDAVYVRVWPLTRLHRFPFDSIRACTDRRYRPLREYGGWGVRCGRNGKAYNVTGNRGVQLVFRDNKRLLLGSQRSEALARAIHEAARARGVELRREN